MSLKSNSFKLGAQYVLILDKWQKTDHGRFSRSHAVSGGVFPFGCFGETVPNRGLFLCDGGLPLPAGLRCRNAATAPLFGCFSAAEVSIPCPPFSLLKKPGTHRAYEGKKRYTGPIKTKTLWGEEQPPDRRSFCRLRQNEQLGCAVTT